MVLESTKGDFDVRKNFLALWIDNHRVKYLREVMGYLLLEVLYKRLNNLLLEVI